MDKLAIVVPCYNEQEVLPLTFRCLSEQLLTLIAQQKIAADSVVIYVDDGSRDNTWALIEQESSISQNVYGVKLSANCGHQNALMAGLMVAKDIADMAVSIDADLQDDVAAIEKMVDCYNDGADIVYGVRASRQTDTAFKRTTAQGFYKLMSFLGAKTIYNHADFRLMSKRALDALGQYGERNMFLRGIVPLLGFKEATVEYDRKERAAGESKYPLKKMLSFAFNGITSFSIKPINMILGLGAVIVALSIVAFIYTLIAYFAGRAVAGWSSLMISIWFLGGVQLLSVGLVGMYTGKIYIEAKHRPRYIVEKISKPDKK
ncbi:MAG: glycosyltransferase family 2 protein [Clostridia bacterium]|nr:glycosyltransferase family 2 protein [Clostridia bacterium]